LLQQRTELRLLGPDCRRGDFLFGGRRTGGRAKVIARKDRFERDGGLGALVAGDLRVEQGQGLLAGGGSVGQVVGVPEQFGSDSDACFVP
jgi:hypothetical protein